MWLRREFLRLKFMLNYFKLLKLPENYDISPTVLEQHFEKIASVYHPDQADFHQAQSLKLFMQLNDAYDTLKDPIKRAEYLLSLRHVPYDPQNILHNPALLTQQFELREHLENCQNKQEMANFILSLRTMGDENKDILRYAMTKENWPVAIEALHKAKYFVKLLQEALYRKQKLPS